MEDKKIKIILAITKSNFGGAQRYVYDIATGLPKNEFNVMVILGGEGVLKQKLEERGISTITINSLGRDVNLFKDFFAFLDLAKTLFKEKPEILHVNSAKISGMATFIGRVLGVKKIIFTAHGFAFNEERTILSKILIRFLTYLTIVFAHKTIAVSKKTLEQVPKFLVPKNKISLIYNGVKKEKILSKKESLERLGLKDKVAPGEIVIISVAELHKSKGLKYSIEAFANIKKIEVNIKYLIIGEGEEKMNLKYLINKLNVKDSVILLGFIKDAPKYLSSGDIFILPSNTEALSLSVLEAGFAKLPVIATCVGGIPEIIESGVTGILVEPKNIKEMERAFISLIKDKILRKNYGENLYKKVNLEFSSEKMMTETISLYKEN